ncbi:hypothetical protein IF803_36085 [Bradyrhizobium sp. UFLA06-06]
MGRADADLGHVQPADVLSRYDRGKNHEPGSGSFSSIRGLTLCPRLRNGRLVSLLSFMGRSQSRSRPCGLYAPLSSHRDATSLERHHAALQIARTNRERHGSSIPVVCQDWANTKAAYRFFSNERVNEADILCGHFEATRGRVTATEGPILVLHDTTEFSFKREKPDLIGFTSKTAGRTQCGILMHSSLAVTTEGFRSDWRQSSSGHARSSGGRRR